MLKTGCQYFMESHFTAQGFRLQEMMWAVW